MMRHYGIPRSRDLADALKANTAGTLNMKSLRHFIMNCFIGYLTNG